MTATFLLPLATGACIAINGETGVIRFAYGLVAMVAMTPLIVLQALGLLTALKAKAAEQKRTATPPPEPVAEPEVVTLSSEAPAAAETSALPPVGTDVEVIDL